MDAYSALTFSPPTSEIDQFNVEKDLVASAVKQILEQRINGIKDKLKEFGFQWNTEEEFKQLCKEKMIIVSYGKYLQLIDLETNEKICGWYDTWDFQHKYDDKGCWRVQVNSGFPPDEPQLNY